MAYHKIETRSPEVTEAKSTISSRAETIEALYARIAEIATDAEAELQRLASLEEAENERHREVLAAAAAAHKAMLDEIKADRDKLKPVLKLSGREQPAPRQQRKKEETPAAKSAEVNGAVLVDVAGHLKKVSDIERFTVAEIAGRVGRRHGEVESAMLHLRDRQMLGRAGIHNDREVFRVLDREVADRVLAEHEGWAPTATQRSKHERAIDALVARGEEVTTQKVADELGLKSPSNSHQIMAYLLRIGYLNGYTKEGDATRYFSLADPEAGSEAEAV